MGNNVVKESDLEVGDHIYVEVGRNSRRHGIVYLDGDVVHFTPDDDSNPSWRIVAQISVEQFQNGGKLQRYVYGTAKWGSGGWTIAQSDPPRAVIGRVMALLRNGFQVPPDLAKTNPTEVFAFYCKTGLFTPPSRYSPREHSGPRPMSRPSFDSRFRHGYSTRDLGNRPFSGIHNLHRAPGFCSRPGAPEFCSRTDASGFCSRPGAPEFCSRTDASGFCSRPGAPESCSRSGG